MGLDVNRGTFINFEGSTTSLESFHNLERGLTYVPGQWKIPIAILNPDLSSLFHLSIATYAPRRTMIGSSPSISPSNAASVHFTQQGPGQCYVYVLLFFLKKKTL